MSTDTSPAVVITGCSTGIGRATAKLLDQQGYRVFAGVRKEADAQSLRGEGSERMQPLLLDVTDTASIEQAAKEISQALGERGLLGLVNNAGIGFGGPMEFTDLDEMRSGFEVNVFGPVAVCQAFLPLLRRARGRIVNVSSAAGRVSTPLLGPYCASKFALEGWSDAMRVELRSSGLHVCIVEPGFIDTPMQDKGKSETQRQIDRLTAEGTKHYGRAYEKFQELLERFGKNAAPAEAVAAAIHRALSADRPRARYTVGKDAKLMSALNRLLPDRGKDTILGRLHEL
jgi:NAD(P)-dependent dehydrogenase (short-subunit alcohol dehydrogenase family)